MNKRSLKKTLQQWSFRFCLWCSSLLICISLANVAVFGQARTFDLRNQGRGTYNTPGAVTGTTVPMNTASETNIINGDRLIDPLGQILNCGGDEFPDYTGFSVGVYEPAVGLNQMGKLASLDADQKEKVISSKLATSSRDHLGDRRDHVDLMAVGEVGALVDLTPTNPPNTVAPAGIAPNLFNTNPYFLTNAPVNGRRGVYNFLFDVNKGQVSAGRTYILLVNPPASLGLAQRRIQLKIESLNGDVLSYSATALDGRPIGADGVFVAEGTVLVKNAENVPLSLIALQLNAAMCELRELQII